jgi:hypothetical protein
MPKTGDETKRNFSMQTLNHREPEPSYAYLLAKVLSPNGKVRASRSERLTCAFVELRERIKDDFAKVAKDWQVPAQELKRSYFGVYPDLGPGKTDLLCLEQACEGAMIDVRTAIRTYADHFGVQDDLLEAMLVDWLVSDRMGSEPTPARFFIPEAAEGSQPAPGGGEGADRPEEDARR